MLRVVVGCVKCVTLCYVCYRCFAKLSYVCRCSFVFVIRACTFWLLALSPVLFDVFVCVFLNTFDVVACVL